MRRRHPDIPVSGAQPAGARILLMLADFSPTLVRAGSPPRLAGSIRRMLRSVPVQRYQLLWCSSDGALRKVASWRWPPPASEVPRLRLVTAKMGDNANAWLECRVCVPWDDREATRALERLLRAALARLLALEQEGRRTAMLRAAAEMSGTEVFLFDGGGRQIDQLPGTWSPLPGGVADYAERLRSGDALPDGATVTTATGVYDVAHRWIVSEPSAAGRLLVVTAQPRPTIERLALAHLPRFDLTRRETQILTLLLGGSTNREVASRLFISTDTVKTHCRHLFRKLNVGRRSELLRIFRGDGGARPEPPAPAHAGRALRFAKVSVLGPACKDRYVRLDVGTVFLQNIRDGSRVRLAKSAIGYCYGWSNGLLVGFSRDMSPPVPLSHSRTTFDYAVRFEPALAPRLSISLD